MLEIKPGELKLQISPTRRVPELLTVWPEKGDEVDMVMDPRHPYGLKLRPGSVKVIYAFGILGLTPAREVENTLRELWNLLGDNGEIYIIEPDFDYLMRASVGGDLPLEQFNNDFIRKSYISLPYLNKLLGRVGVKENQQVVWYDTAGLKFEKHHFEVIVSGKKTHGQ